MFGTFGTFAKLLKLRVNPKLLVPNSVCGHMIFVISVLHSRIYTVMVVDGIIAVVLALNITSSIVHNDKGELRHVSSLLDIALVVMLGIDGSCVALPQFNLL